MTKAEKRLNEHGFFLLKSDTINIDDEISYPYIQYGRFVDDEHTACDMSIIFDPSQYSVMLHEDGSTVYVDPDLLDAIMERTKELKYDSNPTIRNEKDKIYEETMSRVKSEVELKVEEMKLQIKADLDTYIKGCVSLQKNAVNYDNMILENAIQQIEYLKREVDRLI